MRIGLVLVAIAVLASCTEPSWCATADCAAIVRYDGRAYEGIGGRVQGRLLGERLGRGVIPPCNDTGCEAGKDEPVDVFRIKGVSIREAVALHDGTRYESR